MAGAIYWTAREFAVKPDWDGGADPEGQRDAIHNKALISYDGKAKPAFETAKDGFEATPLYRDDPAPWRAPSCRAAARRRTRAAVPRRAGGVAALITLDAAACATSGALGAAKGEGQVVELPTRRVA